jgi:hypothetical protein
MAGGKDDQVPPTFENFVAHKENRKKNEVILYPKVYTSTRT